MTEQRRIRFLFPGLLACVVATLLAVGLMVWVPYQWTQSVIQEIERMGGEVSSKNVVVLLDNTEVNDSWLEHLGGLTNLQYLRLKNTQVSDAGLEYLKGLTNLQGLWLSSTQVGDAGLEHLRSLSNLKGLYLDSTQVSDAGLEHLKRLTNLRELYLKDTQVTDAGVKKLKIAIGNRLKIVR